MFQKQDWYQHIETETINRPITNVAAFAWVMAQRRTGDKPFLDQLWSTYRGKYASLVFNVLMQYSTLLYELPHECSAAYELRKP